MFVKTNYTRCEYITAGKLYFVVSEDTIVDDEGLKISIPCDLSMKAFHLNNEGRFDAVVLGIPLVNQEEV